VRDVRLDAHDPLIKLRDPLLDTLAIHTLGILERVRELVPAVVR
jgi:hypothetical protein